MSERRSRAELDISDFHVELERLLSRYREANYCPGCMGEALIKSGVAMAVATDAVCWPIDSLEEVELVAALAKLFAKRSVGAPDGVMLQ